MVLEAGGLKKIHHFQFKASGEVLCRENVASEVTIFSLLKGPAALPDTQPTIIQPFRPEPAEERISLSGDLGIRRSRLPGLGVPRTSPP